MRSSCQRMFDLPCRSKANHSGRRRQNRRLCSGHRACLNGSDSYNLDRRVHALRPLRVTFAPQLSLSLSLTAALGQRAGLASSPLRPALFPSWRPVLPLRSLHIACPARLCHPALCTPHLAARIAVLAAFLSDPASFVRGAGLDSGKASRVAVEWPCLEGKKERKDVGCRQDEMR